MKESSYVNFTRLGPITNEQEDLLRRKLYNFFSVESRYSNTLGKVLTFIDASIPDAEQRKAAKDVVKNIFYSDMKDIYDYSIEYREVTSVQGTAI